MGSKFVTIINWSFENNSRTIEDPYYTSEHLLIKLIRSFIKTLSVLIE